MCAIALSCTFCQSSSTLPGKPSASFIFPDAVYGRLAAIAPGTIAGATSGNSRSAGTLTSAAIAQRSSRRAAHGARCRDSRGLSTWLREGEKNTPGTCSSFENGNTIIISAATRSRCR